MNPNNPINRSVWLKGLVLAAFAFVGIVGGAYVGHLIIGSKPAEAKGEMNPKAQHFWLSLRAGDLFPYEDYTTMSGTKGNFEQLLVDKQSLVFFVDLDCTTCHDLLRFWNTTLMQRVKPGVQMVVCLPAKDSTLPPEFGGLVAKYTVVFIDQQMWKTRYNLVFAPIMAGVDRSGFLTHLQHGFADEVDYEIAQEFLTAVKSSN
ncbi:MAG: hypothetical protein WAU88_01335 [Candidatus Zixiibacteriota bacterium]